MPRRLRRFFRHGLLPQLIAFEAAVRLGSVTRAAEELSVSQPTISGMLRKLSDAMGGPVTEIRGRRVEATPVGRDLLHLCRDFIAALERFEERRVGAEAVAAPTGGALSVITRAAARHATRWRQRSSRCRRRRASSAA